MTLGARRAMAIGTVLIFILARVIRTELVGVRVYDPATLVTIMLLLVAKAGVACWIPARRATHVDPMVVLRYE